MCLLKTGWLGVTIDNVLSFILSIPLMLLGKSLLSMILRRCSGGVDYWLFLIALFALLWRRGNDAEYFTSNGLNAAKDLLKEDVLFVMGGFHLEWAGKGKIEKIISTFKQLGVRYAGPCHCTGTKARKLFEEHFGENYINIGAGKEINIANLE